MEWRHSVGCGDAFWLLQSTEQAVREIDKQMAEHTADTHSFNEFLREIQRDRGCDGAGSLSNTDLLIFAS